MEVTIEVDDSLIESLGYERVRSLLNDSAAHLKMKIAAQAILLELNEHDPVAESGWIAAREQAWQQEKHRYISRRSE